MITVLSFARKSLGSLLTLLSVLVLAGCQTIGDGGPTLNTARPVPVALLVPHGSASAGDAVLAQSLENAARLAIADLGGVEVDLRVYPTAGQAEQAAASARQAVNDGAKIILGPVFADSANAAGVAIRDRNVNLLTFSNNVEIAGGNVFLLGNTSLNRANRLVSYSIRQGRSNIMVVHGQSTAEVQGKDAIVAAAARHGGNLVGVAPFELSQTGLINAIPGIVRQAREANAQSVFFTSGTDGAIPLLTQLLPENGLRTPNPQFVGLRRWDLPATALSLPGVQEGWFALPDPALTSGFESRYSAAYGTPPHPLASLAYDGIAAIGALARSGQSDALTVSALTQSAGFAGVNGVFRLRADGTNERGLAVATIRENQVVVIDPAPRSFGGAGF